MRVVLISWLDSNVTHGWDLKDDVVNDVAHCETAGIVYAEDEDKITVVLAESDCDSTLERLTIPKGCIKSIRELRVR